MIDTQTSKSVLRKAYKLGKARELLLASNQKHIKWDPQHFVAEQKMIKDAVGYTSYPNYWRETGALKTLQRCRKKY